MSPPLLMQRLALVSHFALILIVALRTPSALSFLLALILMLPLPGLLNGKSYTYAWASMLVAFYVAGYLAAGYARPDTRLWSFIAASVAALDYVSLMMFVRFRARERVVSAARESVEQTATSDDASH